MEMGSVKPDPQGGSAWHTGLYWHPPSPVLAAREDGYPARAKRGPVWEHHSHLPSGSPQGPAEGGWARWPGFGSGGLGTCSAGDDDASASSVFCKGERQVSRVWLPSRIEFPGYLSREAGQRMESHCSVLCDLGQILGSARRCFTSSICSVGPLTIPETTDHQKPVMIHTVLTPPSLTCLALFFKTLFQTLLWIR
jgi:hypothetical protein